MIITIPSGLLGIDNGYDQQIEPLFLGPLLMASESAVLWSILYNIYINF